MEDFWNEYQTVKGRRAELRGSNSEEDSRSHEDDIGFDNSFLETVLADRLKEDGEISEEQLANSRIYSTLTPRQQAQVIRRTHERNFTLRQKRMKARGQKPDLWSVFSGTDNSSTGTRSRSATPDSLDSISPPRTPPDPSPKNWVEPHLSRSIASLDSGHHSLITSPSSSFAPISTPSASPPHLVDIVNSSSRNDDKKIYRKREVSRRYSPPEISPSDKYYYLTEEEDQQDQMIYRAPSLEQIKSQNAHNYLRPSPKEISVRRQRSYAKDVSRDVKNYYSNNKGIYEFNPRLYYEPEGVPDVQGIRYKPIGSMHFRKIKDKRGIIEDNFHPKENLPLSPKGVKRSQSIKHQPRDPFDPLNENELRPEEILIQFEDSNELKDNQGISSGAFDFGFKVLKSDRNEKFPDLVMEIGRSGQTKVDWLHAHDVIQLSSLAILELDIIFSDNNIAHNWRKRNKKIKKQRS